MRAHFAAGMAFKIIFLAPLLVHHATGLALGGRAQRLRTLKGLAELDESLRSASEALSLSSSDPLEEPLRLRDPRAVADALESSVSAALRELRREEPAALAEPLMTETNGSFVELSLSAREIKERLDGESEKLRELAFLVGESGDRDDADEKRRALAELEIGTGGNVDRRAVDE